MPHHIELQHPDIHQAASPWSEEQILHVAACYSNPFQWRARRELASDFRRHMQASKNVTLHMIELAYGDRPFDVTGHKDDTPFAYNDIQVRTSHELFHKENLLNLAVRSFPINWKYGAIINADFHFIRYDWALETIHQLQHYDFVQPYSSYMQVSDETVRGQGHTPLGWSNSFAYNYTNRGFKAPYGITTGGWNIEHASMDSGLLAHGSKGEAPGPMGGAWAFTSQAFNKVGGLLDKCILGSGDWFMAFGLIGETGFDFSKTHSRNKYSKDYVEHITAWQENARDKIKRNIGYVDGMAIHHWHGPMKMRGYGSRNEILVGNNFEPTRDISYDWQGVLQLSGNKPCLRDEIRAYFVSKCEDLPYVRK